MKRIDTEISSTDLPTHIQRTPANTRKERPEIMIELKVQEKVYRKGNAQS